MPENKTTHTDVKFLIEKEKTYKKVGIFGGRIYWWSLIKTKTIGQDLHIITTEEFEHIYINNKELILKP